MQRYKLDDSPYEDWYYMEENDNGDYVLFSDYEAEITALRKENELLHTMSTVEMMAENENVNAHVREWEARCLKAEAKCEKLVEALEAISNPIGNLQRLAEKDGNRLNGTLAMVIADDPMYLRGLAKDTLAAYKEGK